MAENKRVRIEPHLEEYLKSHAQRVLGKSAGEANSRDLSTLTNALLYEHKLANSALKQVSITRLVNWLGSFFTGKVVQLPLSQEPPTLSKKQEDFSFDADLGDLYEDAA